MDEKILTIKKKVKKALDNYRYQHTLGVAYTAASLAMRYGEDMERLFLAGILHDCAKNIDNEEKYELCRKYKLDLSDIEKKAPFLIHGKLGAYIAEHEYGVKDKDILNAVRYHTTGRPGMSITEKIIYIADYIEPHRHEARRLKEIRMEAFTDIDSALRMVLRDSLDFLKGKDRPVDPLTQETYEFYVNQIGKAALP